MSVKARMRRGLSVALSTVVGSLAALVALATPAIAMTEPIGGNDGTPGSTTTSSGGGLEWWAILLIVVGAIAVAAALVELGRIEIRHHRHVSHPAV